MSIFKKLIEQTKREVSEIPEIKELTEENIAQIYHAISRSYHAISNTYHSISNIYHAISKK